MNTILCFLLAVLAAITCPVWIPLGVLWIVFSVLKSEPTLDAEFIERLKSELSVRNAN